MCAITTPQKKLLYHALHKSFEVLRLAAREDLHVMVSGEERALIMRIRTATALEVRPPPRVHDPSAHRPHTQATQGELQEAVLVDKVHALLAKAHAVADGSWHCGPHC